MGMNDDGRRGNGRGRMSRGGPVQTKILAKASKVHVNILVTIHIIA